MEDEEEKVLGGKGDRQIIYVAIEMIKKDERNPVGAQESK